MTTKQKTFTKEEYGDWHSFLEILKYVDGTIYSFFGS